MIAARPRRGTSTTVGALEPAGNDCSSARCPSTDSTVPRNALVVVRSSSSVRTPSAIVPSASALTIHTSRCRRSIHSPSRRQAPCRAVSSLPNRGTNGQNARRPQIRSRVGSSVIIASAATATPMAPTGPRPAVELTEANERHRSAATTVPADATIAGPARVSAIRIASWMSSTRRSSSR